MENQIGQKRKNLHGNLDCGKVLESVTPTNGELRGQEMRREYKNGDTGNTVLSYLEKPKLLLMVHLVLILEAIEVFGSFPK